MSDKTTAPTSALKSRWLASLVSLLAGLGLGTAFGRNLFESAGLPASCIETIEQAEAALATGEAIATDGRDAFDAVKDLRLGDAASLLQVAGENAVEFYDQAKAFNRAREQCSEDRER